jgi:hypothetical protein
MQQNNVPMPTVFFEVEAIDQKDVDGKIIYKNIYFVRVIAHGSKDELYLEAEAWIESLKNKAENRGFFGLQGEYADTYLRWHELFSKAFEKFKTSEEGSMVINGTPLRQILAFTKAEVKQIEAVNIFSVEDLAACNESAISKLGIGGRLLKQRAAELIKNKDFEASAQEIANLKKELENTKKIIASLQKQESLDLSKEKGFDFHDENLNEFNIKKRGRPKLTNA